MIARSYERFRAATHFPELDGLRALCILGVVTFHMKDHLWWRLAGDHGVIVFFVLSGFLITTLALREVETEGRLHVRAFMARRAFRLLPAYYAVLALYALLILVAHQSPENHDAFIRTLPAYVLYYQEVPFFHAMSGGSGFPYYQSWSLGIEEKFYLVWPLLAFVLLAGRRTLRMVAAVALIIVCSLAPHVAAGGIYIFHYAAILCGCVTALLLHESGTFTRAGAIASRPAVFIATMFAFVALQLAAPYDAWVRTVYPAAFSVVLVALVTTENVLARALSHRTLVWIGGLSYGIYLLHLLALNVAIKVVPGSLGTWPHGIAVLGVTCAISVAAAVVLQRTIENPLRRVGRRISDRLRGRAKPAPEPVVVAPVTDMG